MRKILSIMAGIGLVATLAFVGPLGAKPGNKYSNEVAIVHECDQADGKIHYLGPVKMWPPNHKYQPVSFKAIAEDAGDNVTLDTAGTHDEYLEDGTEMNGAGNTDNDVEPAADDDMGTGSAETSHEIRSERSGQGDGRTYTLYAVATFNGEPCEGLDDEGNAVAVPFKVEVPHDMRGGKDW